MLFLEPKMDDTEAVDVLQENVRGSPRFGGLAGAGVIGISSVLRRPHGPASAFHQANNNSTSTDVTPGIDRL